MKCIRLGDRLLGWYYKPCALQLAFATKGGTQEVGNAIFRIKKAFSHVKLLKAPLQSSIGIAHLFRQVFAIRLNSERAVTTPFPTSLNILSCQPSRVQKTMFQPGEEALRRGRNSRPLSFGTVEF